MSKLDSRLAVQCLLIGAVAGLRSMMAPAVVAADIVRRNPTGRGSGLFAVLASPKARSITLFNGVGELVADKLPFIGSRLRAPSLVFRCLSGAVSGGALAGSRSANASLGAALGMAGALMGTYGGYYVRKWIDDNSELPDQVVGLVEDGVALAIGQFATQ